MRKRKSEKEVEIAETEAPEEVEPVVLEETQQEMVLNEAIEQKNEFIHVAETDEQTRCSKLCGCFNYRRTIVEEEQPVVEEQPVAEETPVAEEQSVVEETPVAEQWL